MAKRLGTFKKILAETLLLSSDKMTKWPWRGRTSFLPWLALQGRPVRGGTHNQRGSSRTVLHEGEKAKGEWEGDRGEGRLPLH